MGEREESVAGVCGRWEGGEIDELEEKPAAVPHLTGAVGH